MYRNIIYFNYGKQMMKNSRKDETQKIPDNAAR